jgi:molybdenum cofactor biosynthesis enzyme MoaA
MMLSDTNLTETVRRLFADAKRTISVPEIYEAVEENHPLSVQQKKFTRWGEPLFQHEIRAIINALHQNGEIIRVSRGKYKKA